jgi:hypothetical protein
MLIGQLSYDGILNDLTGPKTQLNDVAKIRAKTALSSYFAGACLLPYDDFLNAATSSRYNIEFLQQRFSASFEQICHRLTTLRKSGSSGIPLHFIRVDVAGNISKRFSSSGLRIPKFGSACPRWIMHHAFMTPNKICSQVMQSADGNQYFSIAKTISKPSINYGHPGSHYSISIGCEITFADQFVYADGLNFKSPQLAIHVGIACQLCDRKDCAQRATPPSKTIVQDMDYGRNISPGIGEV